MASTNDRRWHSPMRLILSLSKDASCRSSLSRTDAEQAWIERALEAHRHRAGHQHMAVGAPLDLERAAVEHHLGLAPGEAAPRRRDQRGAGAAATGDGDAGAALPD